MVFRVQHEEIDLASPHEAVISNPDLAKNYPTHEKSFVDLLKHVSPAVKASDISVDAKGKVVVKNSEFVKAMKTVLANKPAAVSALDNTGACGASC